MSNEIHESEADRQQQSERGISCYTKGGERTVAMEYNTLSRGRWPVQTEERAVNGPFLELDIVGQAG